MITKFSKKIIDSAIPIVLLNLRKSNKKDLLAELPLKFRRCYISDDELNTLIDGQELDASEILDAKLPDKGNVMAGEFGEILGYFILKSSYKPLQLRAPLKWRFKPDAKRAVQYTDIILYSLPDVDNPCPDDLLIAAETKVKSTKSKLHPIQDAIDGSSIDRTRRLAVTLAWLRRRAIINNYKNIRKNYDRFIKSSVHGPYRKQFKAMAFIDTNFIDAEIAKERNTEACCNETEILVVSIPELKTMYEQIYDQILMVS